MTEEENDMRYKDILISRFEIYLDEKRPELNAAKTKVMRVLNRGARLKNNYEENRLERKRNEIREDEEIQIYVYLYIRTYLYICVPVYMLQRNGEEEARRRGRNRKVTAVMKEVWGTRKRI